jgi:hypothetical protein
MLIQNLLGQNFRTKVLRTNVKAPIQAFNKKWNGFIVETKFRSDFNFSFIGGFSTIMVQPRASTIKTFYGRN